VAPTSFHLQQSPAPVAPSSVRCPEPARRAAGHGVRSPSRRAATRRRPLLLPLRQSLLLVRAGTNVLNWGTDFSTALGASYWKPWMALPLSARTDAYVSLRTGLEEMLGDHTNFQRSALDPRLQLHAVAGCNLSQIDECTTDIAVKTVKCTSSQIKKQVVRTQRSRQLKTPTNQMSGAPPASGRNTTLMLHVYAAELGPVVPAQCRPRRRRGQARRVRRRGARHQPALRTSSSGCTRRPTLGTTWRNIKVYTKISFFPQ
jgi:hypothetical protein